LITRLSEPAAAGHLPEERGATGRKVMHAERPAAQPTVRASVRPSPTVVVNGCEMLAVCLAGFSVSVAPVASPNASSAVEVGLV
jgi:hypothetical protein